MTQKTIYKNENYEISMFCDKHPVTYHLYFDNLIVERCLSCKEVVSIKVRL